MAPFLTLYTPTFRRPRSLVACLASVQAQTVVEQIEHLVIVDHCGKGIGGMYAAIPQYRAAVHGDYVYVLSDDDVLASTDAVERLVAYVREQDFPDVVICTARYGHYPWLPLPSQVARLATEGPLHGAIGLPNIITRGDVWRARCDQYGQAYDGDYTFLRHLWDARCRFEHWPFHFATGPCGGGQPERA